MKPTHKNPQVPTWRYDINNSMTATLEKIIVSKGEKVAILEVKDNGQGFNLSLPLEIIGKSTRLFIKQKFYVSPENENEGGTFIVYQSNTDGTKRYFYGIGNRYGSN